MFDDVIIRKAVVADLAVVRACARAAYQQYVDLIGREPAPMVADFACDIECGRVMVCEATAAKPPILGYVVHYPLGEYMQLENVAVWPAHTGCGVGGRLISFVEGVARKQGLIGVELYTNEHMISNQSLYPALGYAEIERAEQAGFKRIFYRKMF